MIISTAIACTPKQPGEASGQPGASTQPAAAARYDPAIAATITGMVHFAGTVPKPKPIDMSGDPDCHGQNHDESLVVNKGALANVLVYVKQQPPISGGMVSIRTLGRDTDAPSPTSGIVVQRGCRYEPHVIAVLAGTAVQIFNKDETTHNVHPKPHANHEWNASQLPHADPLSKTFTQPELMIPVKCNVHPWMTAYINVLNTPFFSVSDEDGNFTLKGLPPGSYTISAVHETLGEQTQQITVAPKENKRADFTFKSGPNPASAAK